MCPSTQSTSKSKYAALFSAGWIKTLAHADTLTGLIDRLMQVQDLSCLCMQAQFMGTDEDAETAEKLEEFLEKYHTGRLKVNDVKDLHFEFSIGEIKCLGFAINEEELAALKAMLDPK